MQRLLFSQMQQPGLDLFLGHRTALRLLGGDGKHEAQQRKEKQKAFHNNAVSTNVTKHRQIIKKNTAGTLPGSGRNLIMKRYEMSYLRLSSFSSPSSSKSLVIWS